MSNNSEKNEKSLAEFVMIVVLVGVLMSIFINYFIKQEDQFSEAGFKRLAQNFTTKIATVHAQWLMDKQPSVVELASINSTTKQLIAVNKQGWVDVNNDSLVCERIWQAVMESPLSFMKQSITAIEVRKYTAQPSPRVNLACRYVLPNGVYFDYNRLNGKVSAVNMENSAK
ncbi:MAG: hypothetical protein OQK09_11650 [Colwellia sp.]|nr:hypothetical protein [Colwellia sp.]MCW8864964.1 hypothetical protein [Colwellia sp.]MCW9082156.1 hypothetical protein [Colwellia sp.]